MDMFNEAYRKGALPDDTCSGDIALLFKKGDARDPRNYRPITLLQTDYKILAKVMANRLKKTVHTIFSKEQVGFVPRHPNEEEEGIWNIPSSCRVPPPRALSPRPPPLVKYFSQSAHTPRT